MRFAYYNLSNVKLFAGLFHGGGKKPSPSFGKKDNASASTRQLKVAFTRNKERLPVDASLEALGATGMSNDW